MSCGLSEEATPSASRVRVRVRVGVRVRSRVRVRVRVTARVRVRVRVGVRVRVRVRASPVVAHLLRSRLELVDGLQPVSHRPLALLLESEQLALVHLVGG